MSSRSSQITTHRLASRLALAASALAGLGLCPGPEAAHAGPIVFAGGDAGAQYDIWPISGNQSTYINNGDHEQGASSASAGASAATGTLSYSTLISDGSGGYIPFTYQAQASGAFAASAEFGSLHASAAAGYVLTPGSTTVIGYDSSDQPYYSSQNNPITVASGGSGYASFEDPFTVSSPVLAYNTPVALLLTGTLDAGGNGGDARLSAALEGDYSSSPLFGGAAGDFYEELSNDGAQYGTKTVTLTAYVGVPMYLNATLSLGASVPFGPCAGSYYPEGYDRCAGQSAFENASDTANIYLEPLGSDYSISFGSGHDYSMPAPSGDVPEPGTLTLFGAALVAMGLTRRRRRA